MYEWGLYYVFDEHNFFLSCNGNCPFDSPWCIKIVIFLFYSIIIRSKAENKDTYSLEGWLTSAMYWKDVGLLIHFNTLSDKPTLCCSWVFRFGLQHALRYSQNIQTYPQINNAIWLRHKGKTLRDYVAR